MISFVGAGPGAKDLITLRGKEKLENADVVVYAGSLVNKELLEYCTEDCKIYNSAEMTLEQVAEVLINAHKEGKNAVRLHTGDPSLYGAVREQMDILDREEIPYDVCPGVSSLFGCSAALKAEYTLPGVSQSLIITRMQGRTPVPERESIASLSQHKTSMVIFLSAGMIRELSEELVKGGYNKNTPAALVYKATWEDEKVIHTTVGNMAEEAEKNNIKKTALIAVGDFLGSEYSLSKLYSPDFTHGYRKGSEK